MCCSLRESDVCFSAAKLFFAYGLGNALSFPLSVGATTILTHGESLVLRLLPKEQKDLTLESLGLIEDHLNIFASLVKEPHGIVLVTGPTGSGKSTTLYSALDSINDRAKKIITVEDPVEYEIDGITQIQIHEEIGYSFSNALRSVLRQDPDVIMIGEIRDRATAEIAIQASLTGHLVLSTLHTNNAMSAFSRLIDMGIEPFLVASPLRAVIAQRLVRRLCPVCRTPSEPPSQEMVDMVESLYPRSWKGMAPSWRAAKGCDSCLGTGYKGRVGIYELLLVTPELQHLVLSGATQDAMLEVAKKNNFRSMREDGLLKAWQGITTLEEVFRVTSAH